MIYFSGLRYPLSAQSSCHTIKSYSQESESDFGPGVADGVLSFQPQSRSPTKRLGLSIPVRKTLFKLLQVSNYVP